MLKLSPRGAQPEQAMGFARRGHLDHAFTEAGDAQGVLRPNRVPGQTGFQDHI
ncbi:MAG: hypothetical protein V3S92_08930 [Alphaproteobacteria bacterium]